MSESGFERAEKAAETVFYGTVGLALYMRDTAPSFLKLFVARGRTELEQHRKTVGEQLGQARSVGEFATAQGAPQILRLVGDNLGRLRERAEEMVAGLGVQPGSRPTPPSSPFGTDASEPFWTEPDPEPAATPAREPGPAPADEAPAPPQGTAGPAGVSFESDTTSWQPPPSPEPAASASAEHAGAGPAPGGLAIPDYDELSASQVVDRLDGLPAHELGAIRDYELAHRARNTILAKIDQLTR